MTIMDIVAAILGSSAITAFVTAWASRRRTSAEASHIIVESAKEVLGMKDSVIDTLRQELAEERTARLALEERVAALEAFIRLNTEFDPHQINGNH